MSRLRLVVALSALFALAVAPTALAHQGNPNYRSVIDEVAPKFPGVRLAVLNLDDRLELRKEPPHVTRRDERVHGDHSGLREREHARRTRSDHAADFVEPRLRCVEHQVTVRSRLDDGAHHRDERPGVGARRADEHRLRGDQRAE